MRVIMLPGWTMPLGYGLTLWELVLINREASNVPYVVAHEFCHVLQYREHGYFKFPFMYLGELISKGYKDNKYEVAARKYGIEHQEYYSKYGL